MTLDELLAQLQGLRKQIGGGVKIGLHPSVFDSSKPTIATQIEIKDVEYAARCTDELWTTDTHRNVVVLK